MKIIREYYRKKSEISVDILKPQLLFSKYLKDHKDANI